MATAPLPLLLTLCAVLAATCATKLQDGRFKVAPSVLKDIVFSAPQLAFRLGSGAFVNGYKVNVVKDEVKDDYSFIRSFGFKLQEKSAAFVARPVKPIEMYEFESCPFCRKVREAVTILDLDVLFLPCPKGGPTYRAKVMQVGGKAQFPYMIDPNTGTSMYESDDIIRYLFKTYGNQEGEIPSSLKGGFFTTLSCALGMMFRSGKGSAFREAKVAKQPLILYGYEASPFCKIVRERLVELEIPHVYKTSARGSSKRSELYKKIGLFQVPYLEDPNTKVAMLESADILKYLETTYAVAPEL